jgi:hypothetical protein
MTVILSVHLVREHIRRVSVPIEEGGRPTTLLLGRLFHYSPCRAIRPTTVHPLKYDKIAAPEKSTPGGDDCI